MESPRHRADAATESTSRRWRGAPEILISTQRFAGCTIDGDRALRGAGPAARARRSPRRPCRRGPSHRRETRRRASAGPPVASASRARRAVLQEAAAPAPVFPLLRWRVVFFQASTPTNAVDAIAAARSAESSRRPPCHRGDDDLATPVRTKPRGRRRAASPTTARASRPSGRSPRSRRGRGATTTFSKTVSEVQTAPRARRARRGATSLLKFWRRASFSGASLFGRHCHGDFAVRRRPR